VLAVVVLTYRQPSDVLADCVGAIGRSGDADEVVVVDNGGDVLAGDLEAAAGRPVVVLRPSRNLGFAGGMNLGISHALQVGASAVAILNDDTTVTDGWLTALAARLLDGEHVGVVQPKLLFPGPTPHRISSVGVHWRADGAGIDIGCGELDVGQYDHPRSIEVFTGAAALLARGFVEATGGFDEDYFLYYEDVDLSLRGRELGWRYVCEPAAVVHHRAGATTATRPEERRYWEERNRLWCLARHAPAANVARGLLRSGGRLLRHPTRAQWQALVDGVGGLSRGRRARRQAQSTATRPVEPADR
jgi:N-acetylglucosaminyl-diphospho-decaprenol L-rhamnosyltransferase